MTSWDGIARWYQDALILKWLADPVEFVKHEYGLGIGEWDLDEGIGMWPAQEEIVGEFYNPKREVTLKDGTVNSAGPYNELWLVAGMRCVSEDTLLTDCASGARIPIKEFNGELLTHIDEEVVATRGYTSVFSGRKPTFKVTLYTGKEIVCSEDHRFLTLDGWKQLRDISIDEQVATPAYIPIRGEICDNNLAIFLAGIIAEGSTMEYNGCLNPRFTNSEGDIVQVFKQAVEELGGGLTKTKTYKREDKVIGKYDYSVTGLNNLIRAVGVYNKKSKDKIIPSTVFKMTKESLRHFLYWYWREDGGVSGTYRIPVYYSTSPHILRGIQHLLLRFGIISRVRDNQNGLFIINSGAFTQIVPEYVPPDTNHSSPVSKILLKAPEVAKRVSISFNRMRNIISVAWKQNVSIWNLRKLKKRVKSEWLDMVTDESIVWDPVISIDPIGERDTWDVCVPGSANFVAEDIVVHNSSKTWLEGTFGAIETFRFVNVDYRERYAIGPSSPAYGLCVASKEQQALDTNFAQLKARFEDSPYFQYMIKTNQLLIQSKSMILPLHKFYIRACSSQVAGEVGRTNKFIIVDEVDRFDTTAGPRSGEEMYRLLTKGTKTFKWDGNSFFCGSPASYDSLSMRKLKEAETDIRIYGINRPTWEMNPSFTYEDFQRDFIRDPFSAMRDWAADPQAGSDVYFRNLDAITWADGANVLERMHMGLKVKPERHNYILAVDPASPKSSNNAYGMAMGHRKYDDYIIDGVLQILPTAGAEIDPIKLGEFLLLIVDTFPVLKFYSDTWNYPIIQERVRRRGVQVVNQIVRRPHYDLFKEAMYDKKVQMPYYKPLFTEMRGIVEVNVTRVDHPRHGSKDVIDCVVQVVNALAEQESEAPHVGVVVI